MNKRIQASWFGSGVQGHHVQERIEKRTREDRKEEK